MRKMEELTSFTVKMPLFVELGKKKKRKYYLNLNIYRLQVGHLINNIKKEYHRIAEPLIPRVKWKYVELFYKIFLPDRRKRDISNVCSVIDKNFCDSLVKCEVIPDDNYEFVQDIHYSYGGYDTTGQGYAEITVKKLKKNRSID